MKTLILAIIAIHGAIHVMGFLHLTGLYTFKEFSGRFSFPLSPGRIKTLGWLWLVAACCWLALAIFIFLGSAPMGLLICCLFLSQLLVIAQWQDAKFGTMANLLIPILIAAIL